MFDGFRQRVNSLNPAFAILRESPSSSGCDVAPVMRAASNTNKYVLDFYSPRRGILQMENASATRPCISRDGFRGCVYVHAYICFFFRIPTFDVRHGDRRYVREE